MTHPNNGGAILIDKLGIYLYIYGYGSELLNILYGVLCKRYFWDNTNYLSALILREMQDCSACAIYKEKPKTYYNLIILYESYIEIGNSVWTFEDFITLDYEELDKLYLQNMV